MSNPSIVRSIGPDTAAIGARAAAHLDIAFRAMLRGPGTVHRDGYMTLVTGEANPMGNLAIVSDPRDPATVRQAMAPLLEGDWPAAVLFPRGVQPEVAQEAQQAGFGIDATMPAMAVDIGRLGPTALPPGYAWARIGEGDEGRAWAGTLATGYGLPRSLARLFAPEVLGADPADDAAVQFFAVMRDGLPVATSMLYLADGLAGIYCVATLPEERGQGLGAHATAEALRVAQSLGYGVGILQSSTAGHGVYLRLGFGDHATVPMFVRMPATP